jgi:hypothetical protein
MFSVFDKNILDGFEKEFLNFCVSNTNIDSKIMLEKPNLKNINFQVLIKSMLTVPYDETFYKGMTNEGLLEKIQTAQIKNITLVLNDFLIHQFLYL